VFTARYGLSVYINDTRFVFKSLKLSLKLSECKLGIKSLGIATVHSVSKFTTMHSAIFNLLHAQKIGKRTDGRTE